MNTLCKVKDTDIHQQNKQPLILHGTLMILPNPASMQTVKLMFYTILLGETNNKKSLLMRLPILSLILALLTSPLIHAEPSTNVGTYDRALLQSLFESYKRGQAYDYARQHIKTMEGDPYFDYFYGVSAIDTGHASEGVFALERVLLIFPDDLVARLELARGYFNLQEYAMARDSFEAVLKTDPPATVKDTAHAYLDKIRISESRYRPTHSGFLEFSMGTDDNVNAGIDENTSFQFVTFLDEESFGQEDNVTSLSGAWNYTHPFSPGWFFESVLSADLQKNQELDAFNTNTGTLQLGISHLQASSKYKAEIISQQFQLDGEEYRSLNGLNFNWQYTLSQQSSLNSSLQYAQLEYPDLNYKNSDLITLSLNYTRAFSSFLQPVFFTTVSLGAEQAEDDTDTTALSETERDIYSLRIGVVLSFTNTLALQTSIGAQNSAYEGAPTTLVDEDTEPREDSYNTADMVLLWAFSRKWRLDTRFSYSQNDSTDDMHNYERNVIDMTVNYTF